MSVNRFSEDVARTTLLWCERHCCLCGRQCGLHIETHHIDPGGGNEIDNCLPVCYDCHGILSHYDPKQPRGRKYRADELKTRRDQIYEKHTRHLVPRTDFKLAPDPRGLPHVRCIANHLGTGPPVQARITVTPCVDGKTCGAINSPHYSGRNWVNLNPGHGFNGWLKLPRNSVNYKTRLLVSINVTIRDPYEREHKLLPFGFVHLRRTDKAEEGWYYEPAPEVAEILNGTV